MDYNYYIGLPYKDNGRDESGIDCWGLVRLFYKREYSIELPSYTEEYAGRADPQLSGIVENYKPDNWARMAAPEPGCVILFNILGQPTHVGIYIGDNKFIHSRGGLDSVVESLTNFKWKTRVEGYYKYAPVSDVVVVGSEHPLKVRVLAEVVQEGTTIQDICTGLQAKYSFDPKLLETIVVMVDGEVVSSSNWSTTAVKSGQQVAYKFVPRGDGAKRLILTIAVMYFAPYLAGQAEFAYMATIGATPATSAAVYAATYAATVYAGMHLINALVPIRPPNDPGQAKSVNLFNGSSNQANKFGAIPVVLGNVRMTAMLGAQPYVETATDTSLLNLLLVWGFGPLEGEDIQVGSKDFGDLYDESSSGNEPYQIHYYGYENTSAAHVDAKYPADIEQIYPNVQIVNEDTDPNDGYHIAALANKCEAIDVVLNFPEGMRSIDTGNGDVHPAEAHIEIQVREKDANGNAISGWTDYATFGAGTYNSGNYTSVAATFDLLSKSMTYTYDSGDSSYINTTDLYQWHVIVVGGGELKIFSGTPFDNANGTISTALLDKYKTGSYKLLTGEADNHQYKTYPDIPANYLKLHSIKMYGSQRISADQQSHLSSYPGVQGFQLSYANISQEGYEGYTTTTGVSVSVTSGLVADSQQAAPGVTEEIFTSRSFSGTSIRGNYGGSFLRTYGVWNTDAETGTFDKTQAVAFPYTGYYVFEASCDDYGTVYVDGVSEVDLPQGGWNGSVKMSVYVTAGTHQVRLKVTDTGGAEAAALLISFTANEGLNAPSTDKTRIVFGSEGFFYKRKDAFNYVHRIRGLTRGYYDVKVTRTNSSNSEPEGQSRRAYYQSHLYSVVGYDYHNDDGSVKQIVKEPVGAPIARSFIRVQSTNKVNGTVDGINALVKSVVQDWDSATSTWKTRSSNNPASLFLHVLTHPANAYKLDKATLWDKVDQQAFIDWHTFCRTGIPGVPLTYNNVITSTTSVMDLLRDIAAAGKASPAYVDGKWTVVIDKPRSVVVQHFTPHNSWGFEGSKALPRVPDAFRVTYVNENKAYQADELIVYRKPGLELTARVFEEIQLPGVTNATQANHLAKWHMAQLHFRPETYTLNVDFEYLICTRGDLVRVTHDVPKWGTGSGRIVFAQTGSTELDLSEEIVLTAGITYDIRVRTQTNQSVLLRLAPITETGYYSTITLANALPANINTGDLYMLGEVGKETQELIVLSVEPADNLSARLTLCDYSAIMYSLDLEQEFPAFNPNISTTNSDVVRNGIFASPEITQITSDAPLAEEISRGIYQNVLQISFANNAAAGKNAERIQLEIVPGDELFDNTSPQSSYEINKEIGYVRITGLITSGVYKLRARYRNSSGSISGPWSKTYTTTNNGRNVNNSLVSEITLDLNGTEVSAAVSQAYSKPSDFKCFEYRFRKDTGVEDFWEIDPTVSANGIYVKQSQSDVKFNLLDMPLPRISTEGITYRVACRALDNNGNYSSSSALGTIVIKTIQ